ncbi:adenine phosphoribosyltransferase [Candidatus Woesearchaeota archaeon]|nr:adenine phosphoribosyltransferase [Candidatus Woesearchaeota archaeon]
MGGKIVDLKSKIRTVPHWPIKGVMFRDITTLLQDPEAFKQACDELYNRYKNEKIDVVVGIESRGFIFGAVLAYRLGCSFVPIRKRGKLPHKTVSHTYQKEYGPDTIEMHEDSIKKGDRVLVIDDLIATGGTVAAATKLVETLGGIIHELAFIIELPELKGREKLKGYKIFTMVEFEGE